MWQPIHAHDAYGIYTVPVIITSRLIAVEITTENSKPTWINAGHIVITANLDMGETVIQSDRLYLPKPTAVLLRYNGDCLLTYRPPRYFGHWIMTLYQWIGPISNSGFET